MNSISEVDEQLNKERKPSLFFPSPSICKSISFKSQIFSSVLHTKCFTKTVPTRGGPWSTGTAVVRLSSS